MERDKTVFIKCPSTDSEYRKNLVLFDFLQMMSIPEGGFSAPYESNPQKFTFQFWIGYLSCLQNPSLEENSFSRWLNYVKSVIDLISKSCDYSLTTSEKILYSYAIAARVYPNTQKYIANTNIISDSKLEKILNVPLESDEQKWAMYIVANTVLASLELEENFRVHYFIEFMSRVRDLENEFPELEKKFDNYRIGKGLYEEDC